MSSDMVSCIGMQKASIEWSKHVLESTNWKALVEYWYDGRSIFVYILNWNTHIQSWNWHLYINHEQVDYSWVMMWIFKYAMLLFKSMRNVCICTYKHGSICHDDDIRILVCKDMVAWKHDRNMQDSMEMIKIILKAYA